MDFGISIVLLISVHNSVKNKDNISTVNSVALSVHSNGKGANSSKYSH